jgi:hypothetical protein
MDVSQYYKLIARSDEWLARQKAATLQRISLLEDDLQDIIVAQHLKTLVNQQPTANRPKPQTTKEYSIN